MARYFTTNLAAFPLPVDRLELDRDRSFASCETAHWDYVPHVGDDVRHWGEPVQAESSLFTPAVKSQITNRRTCDNRESPEVVRSGCHICVTDGGIQGERSQV